MDALRYCVSAEDGLKIQSLFKKVPDILAVEVQFRAIDGDYAVGGVTKSSLFSSRAYIILDTADVKTTMENGMRHIDMRDPQTRHIVLHELAHVEQIKRGFLYRLKMKWWRLTKSYDSRPHELEADRKASELASLW